MKRHVYLVRHGTTLANLEDRFAGRTEEPLHPDGRKKMQELGAWLKRCAIARIYCGPLARTRESAELLGQMLDAPVRRDEDLTEISIPHWDGLTKQEIRQKYGAEYPIWLDTPDRFCLPRCETLAEVQQRGVRAVEDYLRTSQAGGILVVSHLIVIRCIVLHYRQLPLQDFRSIRIANGSVTILEQDADGRTRIVPMAQEAFPSG